MKAADLTTVLWATGILFAALVVVGYPPARRASRIDPLSALRQE